jgi:hypothetical protein
VVFWSIMVSEVATVVWWGPIPMSIIITVETGGRWYIFLGRSAVTSVSWGRRALIRTVIRTVIRTEIRTEIKSVRGAVRGTVIRTVIKTVRGAARGTMIRTVIRTVRGTMRGTMRGPMRGPMRGMVRRRMMRWEATDRELVVWFSPMRWLCMIPISMLMATGVVAMSVVAMLSLAMMEWVPEMRSLSMWSSMWFATINVLIIVAANLIVEFTDCTANLLMKHPYDACQAVAFAYVLFKIEGSTLCDILLLLAD